jgi:hypothetical protein
MASLSVIKKHPSKMKRTLIIIDFAKHTIYNVLVKKKHALLS